MKLVVKGLVIEWPGLDGGAPEADLGASRKVCEALFRFISSFRRTIRVPSSLAPVMRSSKRCREKQRVDACSDRDCGRFLLPWEEFNIGWGPPMCLKFVRLWVPGGVKFVRLWGVPGEPGVSFCSAVARAFRV